MSTLQLIADVLADSPLLCEQGPDLVDAVANLTEPVLGEIDHIESVAGGNVSHVFRLRSTCGVSAILKARGRTFARIPELKVDPAHLQAEVRALETMSQLLPHRFPQVLNVDVSHALLLMNDVFPNGNFAAALAARPPTAAEAAAWGRGLREVHDRGHTVFDDIRPAGDDEYGQHQRGVIFRELPERSRRLAEERLADGGRTLLLGDGSPKNMGFCRGHLLFCDLESAHRGHHLFDLCYALAHLILHGLDAPDPDRLVAIMLDAYGENLDGDVGAAVAVLGSLLFRLLPGNVRYPVRYPQALLDRLAVGVREQAEQTSGDIWSITKVVEQLCG